MIIRWAAFYFRRNIEALVCGKSSLGSLHRVGHQPPSIQVLAQLLVRSVTRYAERTFAWKDYSSLKSQVSSPNSQVPSLRSLKSQVPEVPSLRVMGLLRPGTSETSETWDLGLLGLGTRLYCSISSSCGGVWSLFLSMRSSSSVHSALREASCMSVCCCCIFNWWNSSAI